MTLTRTFSTTELSGWQTCRRQGWLSSFNGRGMEPVLPSHKLLLGVLCHAALQDWSNEFYEAETRADKGLDFDIHTPKAFFDMRMAAVREAIFERYMRRYGVEMDEGEYQSLYGVTVEQLGSAMMENYLERWGRPFPPNLTMLQPEQSITLPVPGTEHCACDGHTEGGLIGCEHDCRHCRWKTQSGLDHCAELEADGCPCVECHRLECTFDAFLTDEKGRICIPDHKTFERRPSETEVQNSFQFRSYTWAVEKLWPRGFESAPGWTEGEAAKSGPWVLYNGLWKRTGEEDVFTRRSSPRPRDDLFYRLPAVWSREEIREQGTMIAWIMNDIARAIEEGTISTTRAWYSCPNCSFQDLCTAWSRGEPTEEYEEGFVPRERTPAWKSMLERAEVA